MTSSCSCSWWKQTAVQWPDTEQCLNVSLCALPRKIWIPEIEYYLKVSSHAQIWPQGAEKQLSKVRVVVVGGCTGQTPILLLFRWSRACKSLSTWILVIRNRRTIWSPPVSGKAGPSGRIESLHSVLDSLDDFLLGEVELSVQLRGPLEAGCPGVWLEEGAERFHHCRHGEAVVDLVNNYIGERKVDFSAMSFLRCPTRPRPHRCRAGRPCSWRRKPRRTSS